MAEAESRKLDRPLKIQRRSDGTGSSPAAPARSPSSAFVDTHCHLDLLLQKAKCATFEELIRKHPVPDGYEGSITTFCDPAGFSPSFGMSAELLAEERVWGCFGMHPHSAKHYNDKTEERILELLRHPRAVAFGEIGLDFNRNASEPDVQRRAFSRQLSLAVQLRLPIVVHSRDAAEETLALLRKEVPPDHRIDLHCCGDDAASIRAATAAFQNIYFGFTAAATYARSSQRAGPTLRAVPLDRLLLETDAPYMPPERDGRRPPYSTSAAAVDAGVAIASILGITPESLFAAARDNTRRFFGV